MKRQYQSGAAKQKVKEQQRESAGAYNFQSISAVEKKGLAARD